jgi:HD-GYP domain-containing protein (c-di-GMP phosphodiesterase class II)
MRIMSARAPADGGDSSELADLARRVGVRMGIRGERLDELVRAAELQDIGRVGIPEEILSRPGPLSDADWEFVRQQPLLGERILSAAPALRPVAALVRSSRERWDGRGYPDGLVGERTPLGSRIIAACVAYQAMTSGRPDRPRRSPREAWAELRLEASRQFDPAVVAALLEELARPSQAPRSVIEQIEPDAVTAAEVAARLRELLASAVPASPRRTPRAWPGES